MGVGLIGLTVMTSSCDGEMCDWCYQSWGIANQILPLWVWGALTFGFLLGPRGQELVLLFAGPALSLPSM